MEEQINMSRLEYIQSLKDTFTTTDAEGNESHYFCDKFLLVKYLKMSDADLELNEKYKMEEKLAKQKGEEGGAEEEEAGGEEETGGEETGGGEEPESDTSDIDDEMMGEVQPESPETTQI
jgi:hypothetical protein